MIVKRAAMLLKLFKLNLSSHVRVFFVLGNVRFKPRHTSRRRVSQAQLEGKEILKVNGIVFLPSPPPFLWIIFSLFLSPTLPQNRFVSFLPPPSLSIPALHYSRNSLNVDWNVSSCFRWQDQVYNSRGRPSIFSFSVLKICVSRRSLSILIASLKLTLKNSILMDRREKCPKKE